MFHPANDIAIIRLRLTTRLLSGKNRYHISGGIDRNFMLRQIIRREFDE